jgi:hypothetical protein
MQGLGASRRRSFDLRMITEAANKAARQAEKQAQSGKGRGHKLDTWRLLEGARRKRCQVAVACPLAISLSWVPAPYL